MSRFCNTTHCKVLNYLLVLTTSHCLDLSHALEHSRVLCCLSDILMPSSLNEQSRLVQYITEKLYLLKKGSPGRVFRFNKNSLSNHVLDLSKYR